MGGRLHNQANCMDRQLADPIDHMGTWLLDQANHTDGQLHDQANHMDRLLPDRADHMGTWLLDQANHMDGRLHDQAVSGSD